MCLVGLVSMLDAPRPEVADAVARCHQAGIRIMVVTGDHGLTARAVAGRVGIDADLVVTGAELEAMTDADLDRVLTDNREIIFARNSPEAKLRIADARKDLGEVVAMTGDDVLRCAKSGSQPIAFCCGESRSRSRSRRRSSPPPDSARVFGTSPPRPAALGLLVAFPVVVWGADEIRRLLIRTHERRRSADLSRPNPALPVSTARAFGG